MLRLATNHKQIISRGGPNQKQAPTYLVGIRRVFIPVVGALLLSFVVLSLDVSPSAGADNRSTNDDHSGIFASDFPTGTENIDVPLTEYAAFTGSIKVVVGGISQFAAPFADNFIIDVPVCSNGSKPTIHAAYFQWYQRWRGPTSLLNPAAGIPNFDDDIDISTNMGGSETFTVIKSSWARFNMVNQATDQRVFLRRSALVDIRDQFDANWVDGNNTITFSGLNNPTPLTVSNSDTYGVGLHVFYECLNDFDSVRVGFSTGLDWFYGAQDQPYAGNFSDLSCFSFPTANKQTQIDVDALLGGQANENPPFRGARLFYQTGSGPLPTVDSSQPAGPADVVANGGTQIGTGFMDIWTSSLGQEWDRYTEDNAITVNAGDTWACLQAESERGGGSAAGISGDLFSIAFSIPVEDTAVNLVSFNASRTDRKQVTLAWETAAEIDNFGFKILRSSTGSFSNAEVIAFVPSSLEAGSGPGARYEWVDELDDFGTYTYWLVDIDTAGIETNNGSRTIVISNLWQTFIPIVVGQ